MSDVQHPFGSKARITAVRLEDHSACHAGPLAREPHLGGSPQSPSTAFPALRFDDDGRLARFDRFQVARTTITLQGACSDTLLDTLPSR